MKIQKIVRAQGDYAKKGDDIRDGDIVTILDGGQVVTGDYGDSHVFKINTRNGEKNLTFNQTSINNLVDEFGDETSTWAGKQVKCWMIRQSISGQLKNVVYLTGKDWDMVDDGKGNLKFAKLNIPIINDSKLDEKDLPF